MDDRLRDLELKWRKSGTPEDEKGLLLEGRRAGNLLALVRDHKTLTRVQVGAVLREEFPDFFEGLDRDEAWHRPIKYSELVERYGSIEGFFMLLGQDRYIFFENMDELRRMPEEYRAVLNAIEMSNLEDHEVPFLLELPVLKSLSLYGAQITDEGLQHLAGLRGRLESLKVWACRGVSDAARNALAEQLGLS